MNAYYDYDVDIINQIGRNAGLDMWDDLTSEEKKVKDARDYYEGIILQNNFGKYPGTLVFLPKERYPGTKSIYSINTGTGKPTINSPKKIIPNPHLIFKLFKH